MTEKELKNRIKIEHAGSGRYKVTILFRNKYYSCYSNDTLAYDALDNYDGREYYTCKQGYMALWRECKRKNNL